jgi:cysteine desulfurase/selenocysteine lyase
MSPQPAASRLPASGEFGDFDGRVWLNTAHQGPLPLAASAAAAQACELKQFPHRIADADFTEVPERLRALLGRLVGADPEEIVLGDSTSHGMHLIANGLRFAPADEVLVVAGDYPATVLPWLRLRDQGVTVREVRPAGPVLTVDDVEASITDRTRVLALTWVNSFTGHAVDLDAIGDLCRGRVAVVVNASQALGARPFDAASTPVDAVVCCGYKWLCGPYATGFAWLRPSFGAQLQPQQAYWLAMQAGRSLDQMRDSTIRDDLGVRALDRFCPADFFDSLTWMAALEVMLGAGIAAVADHDQRLVQRLVDGLDPQRYRLVSPADGPSRSTLVVIDACDGQARARHQRLAADGVDVAHREGNLRLCPHLFTTGEDIDRALEALHDKSPDRPRG